MPWVLLLGLLAIVRVSLQARLSELEWESRRLERLILEQERRRGELLRERGRLISDERLSRIAAEEHMVRPATVTPVQVSALPQPKAYWDLPDEVPGRLSGQQIGQLPPAPPPSGSPGP